MDVTSLNKMIADYIKLEKTDYAVFINGEWGSGKTYYVKTSLLETIKQIKCNQNNENYGLVYVSLYGITSPLEIHKKLFFEVNPKLKSKAGKIAMMTVSKVADFFNVGLDNEEEFEVYNVLGGIPNNRVVVFDDLERLNSDILSEVLGVINEYTEHQNLKVIIVGAENEISEKVNEYGTVKEKLIRFTYTFNPDFNVVYDSLTATYGKEYSDFLQKNKHLIYELLGWGECSNLRTVKFILDLMGKLFKLSEDFDSAYIENVRQEYLKFTTIYCIEYKKGKKREELSVLNDIVDAQSSLRLTMQYESMFNENNSEEREPTYSEVLFKKYYSHNNDKIWFFECIANYVHAGYLDVSILKSCTEKVINEYNVNRDNVERSFIKSTFDKFWGFNKLEDNELVSLVKEILAYVEDGKCHSTDYIEVMYHLSTIQDRGIYIGRFRMSSPNIINKFKRGIKKHFKKHGHDKFLNSTLVEIRRRPNVQNEVLTILDYLSLENEQSKKIEDKLFIQKLVANMTNNNIEAFENYLSSDSSLYIAIFVEKLFPPQKFLSLFLRLTNSNKLIVLDMLRLRIKSSKHPSEKIFFSKLNQLINFKLKSIKNKKVSDSLLAILNANVELYLAKL